MIIGGSAQHFIIKTILQFDWLVKNLNEKPEWSFDTETTGLDFQKDTIFILTFSWQIRSACLIDLRIFSEDHQIYIWDQLKIVFNNQSKKIPHNGSFDIEFLMFRGIRVNNYFADTILMHYLLDENRKHGLEILAAEMTDTGGYDDALADYRKQNKIDCYADIPPEIIDPYALYDADVTFRCYKIMLPQIFEQGLDFVLFHVLMPIQKILIMTEYNGVSIDVDRLQKTRTQYEEDMVKMYGIALNEPQVKEYVKEKKSQLLVDLHTKWENSKVSQKRFPLFDDYILQQKQEKLDFQFNVNSTKQLRELLIEKMKLPVLDRTKKGGICLNDDVLKEYAKKNKFCESLAKFRSLNHLKSTFLDGIFDALDENHRVHTDYLLFSTVTGRPSSRDPNLNNIPRAGTADGIKDIFCSDIHENGSRDWLVEVDQGQAEFRMWMNYCKDPQAYRDLAAGLDIHKIVAARTKGVAIPKGDISHDLFKELTKDVIKPERQQAKNVVFGAMYGRGVKSIAEEFGISMRQAQGILDFFFSRYPFAKRWLEDKVKEAKVNGYVTSVFGRRRRLLHINSPEQGYRAEAERQAVNSPIQCSASDLTFLACIRIFKNHIWKKKLKTRLVLTVYDSLVFNVPDDEIKLIYKDIFYEMIASPLSTVDVQLSTDMNIGWNYGSLKGIDVDVSPDEFYKTLHEMFPTPCV